MMSGCGKRGGEEYECSVGSDVGVSSAAAFPWLLLVRGDEVLRVTGFGISGSSSTGAASFLLLEVGDSTVGESSAYERDLFKVKERKRDGEERD